MYRFSRLEQELGFPIDDNYMFDITTQWYHIACQYGGKWETAFLVL